MRKILVVDDSATDRQYLLESLSRLGYQVVLAENGEDAVAKTRSERPDLVLMDVVMPGVSGFQATRQIARDDATKHIPVIMCTGKTQDTDRVWGLRQGARDYLTKPINVNELAAKIAALG
ncbi:MAG: response regulator [Betaproteobacteria bacterium]|nr:response regulator [Betaproteobacteria bacterium]